MKRKLLIAQYENVRNSIAANVAVISTLVEQSEKLTQLADVIKEKDPTSTIAKDIEHEVADLKDTITELLKKTKLLFDNYKAFAEEVFDA